MTPSYLPKVTPEKIPASSARERILHPTPFPHSLAFLEFVEFVACKLDVALAETPFPLFTQISTMRLPRSPVDAAIMTTLLFPLLADAAGSFPCDHIRPEKTSFNLMSLGGARSVMHHYENHNTTYTVDICKALGKVKDIPPEEQCPNGTRGDFFPVPLVVCHHPVPH